jgi:hypothetical protein
MAHSHRPDDNGSHCANWNAVTKFELSRNSTFFAIGVAGLACAAALSTVSTANHRATGISGRAELPRLMLWAWERPEDLRGVDPRAAGVAFLARTLYLTGDSVGVRPRLQPLRVAVGAPLVAVVRIETTFGKAPTYSARERSATVDAVMEAAQIPGLRGVQIDFDARVSEREFYRALLIDLRNRINPGILLSITAGASWCIGNDWIQGLPIDDAVPMLFRMGVDQRNIGIYLGDGRDFRASACRESLGLSTDESRGALPKGRRIWMFSPKAWDAKSIAMAEKEAEKWQ